MLGESFSDLIRYVNREEWNPYTYYQSNQRYVDTVKFEGYIYFCKKSHANKAPIDDEKSEYWGFLSKDNEYSFHSIKNDLDIVKKLLYSLSSNVRTGFEEMEKEIDSISKRLKK